MFNKDELYDLLEIDPDEVSQQKSIGDFEWLIVHFHDFCAKNSESFCDTLMKLFCPTIPVVFIVVSPTFELEEYDSEDKIGRYEDLGKRINQYKKLYDMIEKVYENPCFLNSLGEVKEQEEEGTQEVDYLYKNVSFFQYYPSELSLCMEYILFKKKGGKPKIIPINRFPLKKKFDFTEEYFKRTGLKDLFGTEKKWELDKVCIVKVMQKIREYQVVSTIHAFDKLDLLNFYVLKIVNNKEKKFKVGFDCNYRSYLDEMEDEKRELKELEKIKKSNGNEEMLSLSEAIRMKKNDNLLESKKSLEKQLRKVCVAFEVEKKELQKKLAEVTKENRNLTIIFQKKSAQQKRNLKITNNSFKGQVSGDSQEIVIVDNNNDERHILKIYTPYLKESFLKQAFLLHTNVGEIENIGGKISKVQKLLDLFVKLHIDVKRVEMITANQGPAEKRLKKFLKENQVKSCFSFIECADECNFFHFIGLMSGVLKDGVVMFFLSAVYIGFKVKYEKLTKKNVEDDVEWKIFQDFFRFFSEKRKLHPIAMYNFIRFLVRKNIRWVLKSFPGFYTRGILRLSLLGKEGGIFDHVSDLLLAEKYEEDKKDCDVNFLYQFAVNFKCSKKSLILESLKGFCGELSKIGDHIFQIYVGLFNDKIFSKCIINENPFENNLKMKFNGFFWGSEGSYINFKKKLEKVLKMCSHSEASFKLKWNVGGKKKLFYDGSKEVLCSSDKKVFCNFRKIDSISETCDIFSAFTGDEITGHTHMIGTSLHDFYVKENEIYFGEETKNFRECKGCSKKHWNTLLYPCKSLYDNFNNFQVMI